MLHSATSSTMWNAQWPMIRDHFHRNRMLNGGILLTATSFTCNPFKSDWIDELHFFGDDVRCSRFRDRDSIFEWFQWIQLFPANTKQSQHGIVTVLNHLTHLHLNLVPCRCRWHVLKILKVSGLGSKDVRACCGTFCFVANPIPLSTSSFGTCWATGLDNRTHSRIQYDDYDKPDAHCTREMDRNILFNW